MARIINNKAGETSGLTNITFDVSGNRPTNINWTGSSMKPHSVLQAV